MRAITFQGIERVECSQVPEPKLLDDGDALVQVEFSAICGSDLHVYHGRETGLDAGTILGHEFVGRIVDPGRSGLSGGQRVASPFTTNCGDCAPCRRGLSSRCERGQLFGWLCEDRGLHGAQAEYVRVPLAASTLFALPDDLSWEAGLLMGDVLGTGTHALRQSGARAGDSLAVIGCGPVGLMAVLAAVDLGCSPVYGIDLIPERLRFAERLGAQPIAAEEALDALRDFHPAGLRAVIDAVGSPQATRLAYELLEPGGTLSVVGVHTEAKLELSPAELYDKNLTLSIGRSPARSLMPELTELARAHQDSLRELFTHRMSLEDGVEAYRLFAARDRGCLKILLSP